MYIEQIDTFYVEVPKTGTSSFVSILPEMFDQSRLKFNGHKKMSEIIKALGREPRRSFGVVRNPWQRIFSSVNYACNTWKDVDECFEMVVRGPRRDDGIVRYFAFASQSMYFDAGQNVQIYPLERVADAAASIGWTAPLPRLHVSERKFDSDDVQNHPLFEKVMRYYQHDCDLYTNALDVDIDSEGFITL